MADVEIRSLYVYNSVVLRIKQARRSGELGCRLFSPPGASAEFDLQIPNIRPQTSRSNHSDYYVLTHSQLKLRSDQWLTHTRTMTMSIIYPKAHKGARRRTRPVNSLRLSVDCQSKRTGELDIESKRRARTSRGWRMRTNSCGRTTDTQEFLHARLSLALNYAFDRHIGSIKSLHVQREVSCC